MLFAFSASLLFSNVLILILAVIGLIIGVATLVWMYNTFGIMWVWLFKMDSGAIEFIGMCFEIAGKAAIGILAALTSSSD